MADPLDLMGDLYPLLMQPAFDPRPWGTKDLSPIYPNHRFSENIGESWLTGDDCKVANGPLSGQSLAELAKQYGRNLIGDAPQDSSRFPLLLKFLFPHEKLSVQVHPDDEAAHAVGEPCGKTECWYVAYAKPGSQIALGLKKGVTRTQLQSAIKQQTAEELLNWVNVYPGEMIYVAGGTVHTLGPGSIIVETQQQSDTTYRLYDYGRPRELHLERGLAAVKEKVASGKTIRTQSPELNGNWHERLISAPYFVVEKFSAKEKHEFQTAADADSKSSVQILVAIDGCASVEVAGAPPATFSKGDAIVIPASTGEFQVRPQWSVEFLKASVPGRSLPEPETEGISD
jgi:mannose-6-phosphate isomerase